MRIDVKRMEVDLLSASAHKFNGPRGIGFLYVKRGTRILPYMNGGSQEAGLRAGTENLASIVGMAVALKNNCDRLEQNASHIRTLEDRLMEKLNNSGLDFIKNGSMNHLPGIINLSFKGQDGEAILHRMDLMGIEISTGSACDNINTQISHVIKAIGVPDEYAKGTIRISLGKNNKEDEIERVFQAIRTICG